MLANRQASPHDPRILLQGHPALDFAREIPLRAFFIPRIVTKRENSIHVKLCDETYEWLQSMADVQGKPVCELAAILLADAVLGRAHGLRLVVERHAGKKFPSTDKG